MHSTTVKEEAPLLALVGKMLKQQQDKVRTQPGMVAQCVIRIKTSSLAWDDFQTVSSRELSMKCEHGGLKPRFNGPQILSRLS